MFDFLFIWRKATQCKKLVTCLHIRLKILKNKKQHIVKQLRDNIALLLENGQCGAAFSCVEQLFADQCLLAVYGILENYCEFITVHFPYIRKHKKCPDDIKEAVLTLLFAVEYLGELPELKTIQKLFTERYGRKFSKAATESDRGSFVNHEVIEKLCIKPAPHDMKIKLINETAHDYMHKLRYIWHNNMLKPDLLQLTKVGGAPTRSDKTIREQSIFTLQEVEEFQILKDQHGEDKRIYVFITSIGFNTKLMNRIEKETNIGYQTTTLGIDEVEEGDLFDFPFNKSHSRGMSSSCTESETGRIVPYFGKMRQCNIGRELEERKLRHVHPKLPDYDELVAKFNILKKEYQQKIVAPRNRRF
ncbi:hypothetical protein ACFE04_000711 [Oxalis oulophora]